MKVASVMLYLQKRPFQKATKQYTKGYIKTEKEQCFVDGGLAVCPLRPTDAMCISGQLC